VRGGIMSRTAATEASYIRNAESKWSEFSSIREENGLKHLSEDIHYDFIIWLMQQRPRWTYGTWRQFKASIVFWLRKEGLLDYAEALVSADLSSIPCKPKKTATSTSSKKAKNINENDYLKLMDSFISIQGSSIWAERTMVFFAATLITGLRPCEWRFSEVLFHNENNKQVVLLKVKNAKDTNGRSHGEYRHLILNNYSDQAIQTILQNIGFVKGYIHEAIKNSSELDADEQSIWDKYYSSLRKRMYETVIRLWPKRKTHPTLYTARHQFIGNLKAAGYSKIEVAALAGHGSDVTAGRHYCKKRSGQSIENLPVPVQAEVERVRINEREWQKPALK